jgi:hypothetical protein
MKKLVIVLGLGVLATACIDSDREEVAGDEALGAAEGALLCDDCDGPPTGADPVMLQGPYQEIRPFERRCSVSASAGRGYNVFGDIQPRGVLAKPVRVQVYQGTTQLISLPVTSGGFSVTLSKALYPNRFPGSFITCIKNPGSNTVSVDAQATLLIVN